jgi:hypothetical protein
MKPLALEQRAGEARIERQARHGAAAARDAPLGIEGLQFLQQPIAVAECA